MKGLKLGSLEGSMGKAIPYFIRLVHPVSFSDWNLSGLCDRIKADQEKNVTSQQCDWEVIQNISKADSFLGKIQLASTDGNDKYLDYILYKDESNKNNIKQQNVCDSKQNVPNSKQDVSHINYLFFRLKNSILQKFKSLYFTPEKEEICLRMLSCEFIPFKPNLGFLSICFTILPSLKDILFSNAISVNYCLPFIQHSNIAPLIYRIKDKDKNIVEHKTYISTLFEMAYSSLIGKRNDLKQSITIQDCWDTQIKFDAAGNLTRLFFMSYLVLATNDEVWESSKGEEARQFYYQITRWSEDGYKHDIEPLQKLSSPEKTARGFSTRFCAMSERGITSIGLGANEFERNNFLPKFRESNFFALLLAWYFDIAKKGNEVTFFKEWGHILASFPVSSFFGERPRQEFFEACLEYKKLGKDFISEITRNLQLFSKTVSPKPVKEEKANRFCNQGDSWEVVYEGEKAVIKNIKGMHYIAYLLKNKGCEFSVAKLFLIFNSSHQELDKVKTKNELTQEDQKSFGQESSSPILDEEAIKGYNKRLQELKSQEKEQGQNTDAVKKEIDFIEKELKKNAGYKGKSRKFNDDPEEKKRKNICNALSSAIEKISERHTSLATHLLKSISKGKNCCYFPEQRDIVWIVDL